jgi:hypothetical protein
MENNQLVGTLCMDICINEEITLPKCVTSDLEINDLKSSKYKFYLIDNIDSSFIVPTKSLAIESNSVILDKNIRIDEFEMMLSHLVKVI